MKTRIVIGSLVATMVTFQVLAQRAENDDMYFNSKDREKMKSESPSVSDKSVNDKIDSDYNTFRKKHFDKNEVEADSASNPTDSFSARNTNPEYISRSNSEQASEDEQNYYVEGYSSPSNTYDSYSSNNYNNGNYSNYNNNWNNSNYGNYGYGYSPYNSLYSPYYGSCNPWMSPYYGGSGLTMSLGYMYGSPGWNYGMSYGYGYGNSYYNPYSYGYYNPYSYYGNPYYYSGGYESSNTNYGKRPSRHSAVVTPTPRYQQTSNSDGSSNGRTRQKVDEYYVKPYKRATTSGNSSTTGNSSYSRPSSTDYPATRTRDSYSSPTRESRPASSTPSYSTPSRSSSSGSTPSRSSGGSSTTRKRD